MPETNHEIAFIIYMVLALAAILYLLICNAVKERKINRLMDLLQRQIEEINELKKEIKYTVSTPGYDHVIGGEKK
jgi:hypothetical protein